MEQWGSIGRIYEKRAEGSVPALLAVVYYCGENCRNDALIGDTVRSQLLIQFDRKIVSLSYLAILVIYRPLYRNEHILIVVDLPVFRGTIAVPLLMADCHVFYLVIHITAPPAEHGRSCIHLHAGHAARKNQDPQHKNCNNTPLTAKYFLKNR
jgi:hypothetical protein